MDNIPVSRRTRFQKSQNNNQSVNLRKNTRKDIGGNWVSNSGFSSSDDDDDDDDDDDEEKCVFIDESEFLEAINCDKCERNYPKEGNLGRFDDNDDDHDERFVGFDDNNVIISDDEEIKGSVVDDNDHWDSCIVIDDDDSDNDYNDDDHHHDDGGGGESFMEFEDKHGNKILDDEDIKGKIVDDDGDSCINIDDDHDCGGGGGGGYNGNGSGRKNGEDTTNIEFQTRVFEGMVLPMHPKKTFEDSNNFIGKRTRSHYKPMFPRKKFKDGTIKCPITIDIDSSSSSSSSEDDEEEDIKPETKEGLGHKRKRDQPPLKKVKEEVVELEDLPKGKSRTRVKKLKVKDAHTMLLNAMLENKNENEGPAEIAVSYLPRKFSFGGEILQGGEEEEEELGGLFKEMELALEEINFALGICDIGVNTTSWKSHGDKFNAGCYNTSWPEKRCDEGKHYWVHDEEIGIKCKFCSFVNLETRYIFPEFYKDPFGPRDNRYHGLFPNDYSNGDSNGFEYFDNIIPDNQGDDLSPMEDTWGTVWDLIPGVKRTLYPHQREGFEFIWRNLAGRIRVDELINTKLTDQSSAGGCIISHAPGTGKTRLATVFLLSFMKMYPTSKPLIVAPCNILRTWEDEFARWNPDINFFNLKDNELSERDYTEVRKFCPKNMKFKDEKTVRMGKIVAWSRGNGCVLGISYELFQRLAGFGRGVHNEKVRQVLLKHPDVLVMDEGHRPRNENSKSWRVLLEVATKRRVILSGTPFQNNLDELCNTISLVREDFAGFCSSHLSISNGRRIEKIWNQIKDFVHVHHGEVLTKALKGMHRSLVFLRPSDLQKRFFSAIRRCNFIKYDNLISVSSVHPSIFCDEQEGTPSDVDGELGDLLKMHKMDYEAGVKTRFLVELIKLCKGERVLVFGQYLSPLNFIEGLLKSLFQWTKGREIFYIDGEQEMKERHLSIKLFNDPKSEARVLLASIKACSEGIDLVGASRVVLLDVAWNPSVLRQAICRAYRLGQQRTVFVYHLIASRTLEEEKWLTQARKEHVSEQLFVSSSDGRDMEESSIGITEDCVLEALVHHEKAKDMFRKIIYQPKLGDLTQSSGFSNL